jgi:hypothetical protein
MIKLRGFLAISISIAVLNLLIPSSANAAFEGSKCSSLGSTKVVSGVHYYCSARYSASKVWIRDYSLSPTKNTAANSQNKGHWVTSCRTTEVANPNYNASKGYSAIVNEPTIRTQQCSQVWVTG